MSAMFRKCEKCGIRRNQDMSVTYYRFPVPGERSIAKARAWAKFCWPDIDFSTEQLQSLNRANKQLCGRHFKSSDFYDSDRKKLSIFAIPSVSGEQEAMEENDAEGPYSSAQEQDAIEAEISDADSGAEPETEPETEAEIADDVAHEEEEEVWTEAEIMACEECGRPAETDGKLFQCVECPRVLCAQCERADRHRHHCMLRLPSRRIYDKMRILFESIREAVTARLTEDDDYDPDLEPKDEPIDPDPLNTTLTEDPIQQPAETPDQVKPQDRKHIIVKARTLVPPISVPGERTALVDKSEPIPDIVIEPKPVPILQTIIKPKFVLDTRTVHEPTKTVPLETAVPISTQILHTVIKPKSIPVEKPIPITRTVPKPIPVQGTNYVTKTNPVLTPISFLKVSKADFLRHSQLEKSTPELISIPVGKVPKPIPIPALNLVPEAKTSPVIISPRPKSETVPVRTVPIPIQLPPTSSVVVPKTVPEASSIPKGKSLREVLAAKVAILKRPRSHEHRYRQISTRTAIEAFHETTRLIKDEECEDTAKRKKTDDEGNDDDVFTEIEYLSDTELTETTNDDQECW